MADVIDDLEAEHDAFEALLDELSPDDWSAPSAAAGWTVTDVVLHLAQTEEAIPAALAGEISGVEWRRFGDDVDTAMDAMVRSEAATPADIFERWRSARQASVRALRAADPGRRVQWVASTLKPRSLATTRLAEHWAHALDIAVPLELAYPDTGRLRHVAWLGVSTLPYAFGLEGRPAPALFCDLTAPDGSSWQFGDPSAPSSITGDAAAFCRVGAQRLDPAASGLRTEGPDGEIALRLLRNYAST
ncbi:maleylpyruvate isomerase family mycothiol-dependent enzyme [Actinoplanes sp. NPDC051633]|uniref:maleylpyruvate isomerase family mycothiol-dependent enzyme n=1 Tax=Actinoplanes sp. NPDC051633 TaxID=3155670 RepID=UPI00341D8DF4